MQVIGLPRRTLRRLRVVTMTKSFGTNEARCCLCVMRVMFFQARTSLRSKYEREDDFDDTDRQLDEMHISDKFWTGNKLSFSPVWGRRLGTLGVVIRGKHCVKDVWWYRQQVNWRDMLAILRSHEVVWYEEVVPDAEEQYRYRELASGDASKEVAALRKALVQKCALYERWEHNRNHVLTMAS